MTQLLSKMDNIITHSEDHVELYLYNLMIDVRNEIKRLEANYENILLQNEKLRGENATEIKF